jgi:AraC-like DNA-binding protein
MGALITLLLVWDSQNYSDCQRNPPQSDALMFYSVYKPSEALSSFISFYWILEMDSSLAFSAKQRIIPNGCVELIFHFGDRLNTIFPDQKPEKQPQSLISGQSTKFYDVEQSGKTGMLSILFKPHGARMFFDLPISEITNQNVDLNLLGRQFAPELTEKIALACNHETRITIIEDYLISKLTEQHLYNSQRLARTIEVINRYKGLVGVAELASIACLSHKQYDRIFYDFVGLHPKEFLKIVRLQYVFHHHKHKQNESLTGLAYACGYYDQAHFVNDFKSLTGLTPKQCFAECNSESDYFLQV